MDEKGRLELAETVIYLMSQNVEKPEVVKALCDLWLYINSLETLKKLSITSPGTRGKQG